jgi:hypothetical protein
MFISRSGSSGRIKFSNNKFPSTFASAVVVNATETAAWTATVYPLVPDLGHPTVLAEAANLS